MKTILFLLSLFLIKEGNAQPNWNWVNSYGNSVYLSTNSMCTDANGTSYITGIFQTTIVFGNDTLSNPNGGTFITKIDSSGNPIWAKMFRGYGLEINDVSLDDSGNFYLTGSLFDTTIFDNDTIITNVPYKCVFLGKFDRDGNLIWSKLATGVGSCKASGVAVNSLSEVYITGLYDTSITFGTTILQVGNSSDNVFVAKYDNNGNNLWALSSAYDANPTVSGIVCDESDHVCITGFFSDSITFGNHTLLTTFGTAILLVQFDSTGDVLWAKQSSGVFPSSGFANCLSTDSSGNFYCAGNFNSSIVIFENDTLFNSGNSDIFLAKYDNLGNFIWAKSAGAPGLDDADVFAIKSDDEGNTYMTGFFRNFISFGSTSLSGLSREPYVVKYDTNGNMLWAVSATGDLNEVGLGIGIDLFNQVYVYGHFTSPTCFFGQDSISNNDIFFARLGYNPTAIIEMEYSQNDNLLIYPNPSSGHCRIMNEDLTNSILRMYDVQGRMINEIVLNNERFVDLKNISAGIYFLQLSSSDGIRNGKLVVE